MKHTLLIITLLLAATSASAQITSIQSEGLDGLIVPRGYSDLVSAPSPEAAAVARYNDVPVSHATGTANIAIPLAEWSCGAINMQIGIAYQTGGIRRDDIPGVVGQGWSLTGLGRVSRHIVGYPDETNFSILHKFDKPTLDYVEKLLSHNIDACRDKYSYDIPGHSGNFFIVGDSIVQMPQTDLVIKRHQSNSGSTDVTFSIMTTDGTLYEMTETEKCDYLWDPGLVDTNRTPMKNSYKGATQTWYLTKITAAGTSDYVTISYRKTGEWTRSHISHLFGHTVSWNSQMPPVITDPTAMNVIVRPLGQCHTTYKSPLIPDKIISRTGSLYFHCKNFNSCSLDSITMRNHTGRDVRTIKFRRSIDCLSRIEIYSEGQLIDKQKFTYHLGTGGSNRDIFGFHNGQSEPQQGGTSVVNEDGEFSQYRSTDSYAAQRYALLSISTLSGARTEFEYEGALTHDFKIGAPNTAIGLRLKSIRSYDEVAAKGHVRKFFYEDPVTTIENVNKLSIYDFLSLSGRMPLQPSADNGVIQAPANLSRTLFVTMNGSSRVPGAALENARVLYNKVTEIAYEIVSDNHDMQSTYTPVSQTVYTYKTDHCVHKITNAVSQCGIGGGSDAYRPADSKYLGIPPMVPGVTLTSKQAEVYGRVMRFTKIGNYNQETFGQQPLPVYVVSYRYVNGKFVPATTVRYSYSCHHNPAPLDVGTYCESIVYSQHHQGAFSEYGLRSHDDFVFFVYDAVAPVYLCDSVITINHRLNGDELPRVTVNRYHTSATTSGGLPGIDGFRLTRSFTQPYWSTYSCGGDSMSVVRAYSRNAMSGYLTDAAALGQKDLLHQERWMASDGTQHVQMNEFRKIGNFYVMWHTRSGFNYSRPLRKLSITRFTPKGQPTFGMLPSGVHFTDAYGYDGDCLVSRRLGPLSFSYEYIPLIGCTKITDPTGQTATYTYEGSRLVSVKNHRGLTVKAYEYDLEFNNCAEFFPHIRISTPTASGTTVTENSYNCFGGQCMSKIIGGAGQGSDLMTVTEHDGFGRKIFESVPFVFGGFPDCSSYPFLREIRQMAADDRQDQRPSTEYTYDEGTSDTPSQIRQPGEEHEAHCLTNEILTNLGDTADDYGRTDPADIELQCRLYTLKGSNIHYQHYAPMGKFTVNRTIDADGHRTLVFTDWRGNKYLERRVVDSRDFLDTYYIHDVWGRLRVVLMPQWQEIPRPFQPMFGLSAISEHAYVYTYDNAGRLTEKRTPDSGTHYFRYDTYGRMVFSQSPVEREAGRCRFYIYDGGARNVVSGICNDSSMPAEGTDAPAYNASLDISGKSINIIGDTGYDAGTMAMSISRADPQILTVDYYDTYDFVQLPGMPSSFTMRDPKYGLLTGRIERVLEPDDTDPSVSKRNATRYLRSHMCYDDLGRATRTTSDLSYGPTSVVTTDYNRVSQPVTETFTILNLDRFEEINPRPTHTLHYTYDRLGRQKSVSATIGDSANVTLKDVAYDAYGRVASSACDGLATKFTYDISSRVTGAAGDFFDDRIARSAAGAVTGIRTYFMFRKFEGENTLYSYDGAGRLTGSTTIITNLTSPKTGQPRNTAYTYDRNSNVTAVRRRGPVMFSYADNTPLRWGDVDDITMTYDGNRLRKASDAATSPLIESSYDFTDGADESVEYLYDADGRLTDDLNRGISVEWNETGQPLRIHLADGRWIAYGYTASGTKIFEELREHAPVKQTPEMATSGMTPGNFGTEVDPSLLSQYPVDTGNGYRILENRGYFGAWETEGYSLRRINLPGAYWADGKLHAMHTDWQGNIRGVSTGTKMKQHNIFYPYGMLAADSREPAMNRYKYGAKEFETRDAANFAYHGARLLYHDLMRFFSPDKLAEANPGVSPYSYCAADPINYTDPTGLIWADQRDRERLQNIITDRINVVEQSIKMNHGDIDDLNGQLNLLRHVNDVITEMENDPMHTYHLAFQSYYRAQGVFKDGYEKDDNTISVTIFRFNDPFALHEITHIGQSLENEGLHFGTQEQTLNGLLYATDHIESNSKEQIEDHIKYEIEAYRIQYSLDNDLFNETYSPNPNIKLTLKDINRNFVGNLNNGKAYPKINKYLNSKD